jgi:hypothetical protein
MIPALLAPKSGASTGQASLFLLLLCLQRSYIVWLISLDMSMMTRCNKTFDIIKSDWFFGFVNSIRLWFTFNFTIVMHFIVCYKVMHLVVLKSFVNNHISFLVDHNI